MSLTDVFTARPPAPSPDNDKSGLTLHTGQQRGGVALLRISITDPRVLQRCYLPFFRNGGLFIATEQTYQLRQPLFLILNLPTAEGEQVRPAHALTATVAWLTPALAQGSTGIGVHFDREVRDAEQSLPDVKKAIESVLSALL